MCETCACIRRTPNSGQLRGHAQPHAAIRGPAQGTRSMRLALDLVDKSARLGALARARMEERGVHALNLIGAPGAGKTALLEATLARLRDVPAAVLEGDQQTDLDAARIRATGVPVHRINTGGACHLDPHMIIDALNRMTLPRRTLLFVENVGNLACPALFDIGERAKVVVMSVTEGEDTPLKHPQVFAASEALVLTKVDLLPHLPFDVERCVAQALQVNRSLKVFLTSATTGEGVAHWCRFVRGFAEPRVSQEAEWPTLS